jgi:S-formylglutathione hydrolase FrmB
MKKLAVFTIVFLAGSAGLAQPARPGGESGRQQRLDRPEVKWVNPGIPEMPGLEHRILNSSGLGHEVGYVVYTPESYDAAAKRRYPVVYFLHGAGGNESSDAAGFSGWVVKAMKDGIMPPVICVFPNGGRSGYRDEVEKMIMEELIPAIDRDYRTIARAKGRSVAGFSMGGAGAVYLSARHPALFVAVASMGGGFRGGNDELLQAVEAALPVWRKNKTGFFLVNGDQDRPEAFEEFSAMLTREGIENERMILPDTKHNLGLYYERSVLQLLKFVGNRLKK